MFDRRAPAAAAVATSVLLSAGCCEDSIGDISNPTDISTRWVAAPAGKFLLQGKILQKYLEVGGSNSPLGSPISNEQPGPGDGRYSLFEVGAIYWTPETDAHVVSGEIRNVWEFDNGGPAGPLGYPTTDQFDSPGGPQQRFQHGTIADGADGRPHAHFDQSAPGS